MKESGKKFKYSVGTMIEVPRGALTADEIAHTAEFFSFGTNDLTQMCLGMSRDDSGSFLPTYQQLEIIKSNPFASIDVVGVGQLMQTAVTKGRATREGMKMGICGEHGGDPASVHFCHRAGMDYVSCSPFRVPIARLAAALDKTFGRNAGDRSHIAVVLRFGSHIARRAIRVGGDDFELLLSAGLHDLFARLDGNIDDAGRTWGGCWSALRDPTVEDLIRFGPGVEALAPAMGNFAGRLSEHQTVLCRRAENPPATAFFDDGFVIELRVEAKQR
jgi:hypothetical protein